MKATREHVDKAMTRLKLVYPYIFGKPHSDVLMKEFQSRLMRVDAINIAELITVIIDSEDQKTPKPGTIVKYHKILLSDKVSPRNGLDTFMPWAVWWEKIWIASEIGKENIPLLVNLHRQYLLRPYKYSSGESERAVQYHKDFRQWLQNTIEGYERGDIDGFWQACDEPVNGQIFLLPDHKQRNRPMQADSQYQILDENDGALF